MNASHSFVAMNTAYMPGTSFAHQYLPSRLATTATEIFDYVQAPQILVIAQMLVMASSIVMLRHRVQCGPGIYCQTGLAALILGEPNIGKSTIDQLLASPVAAWKEQRKSASLISDYDYEMAVERHKAKVSVLRSTLRHCAKHDLDDEECVAELGVTKLQKPQKQAQWVDQFSTGTFQGLADVARRQGHVFWNAPDGGAALKAMTAAHSSELADFWSGNCPAYLTRSHGVEDGRKIAFAASIAVQPDVFSDFLGTKVGRNWESTGLLGRFLLVAPTSNIGYRSYPLNDLGEPKLEQWRARIGNLLNTAFATTQSPEIVLTLSPDAYAVLNSYRSFCEANSAPGRPFYDVRNGAGKSAENAARIAAIFHVLEEREGTEIQVDLMCLAVRFAHLCLDTYMQQFSEAFQLPRIADAVDSLVRYLWRQSKNGVGLVPVSSISKHGNKDLRDPNIRLAAINLAFNNLWIGTGQPSPISKHNLVLTDAGRMRAEMTLFWPRAIRV